MSKELSVVVSSNEKELEVTETMIREYICPNATKKEIFMFLKLCEAQNLNPFIGEAYLIKYGSDSQMIVGKEVFLKRAEINPSFLGFQAGIITQNLKTGEIFYKAGSFYPKKTEELMGGWAMVKKNTASIPVRIEITLQEYIKTTKEGQPVKQWRVMPATMIRKVALVQAFRETFPNALSACYAHEELSTSDISEDDIIKNIKPITIADTEPIVFKEDKPSVTEHDNIVKDEEPIHDFVENEGIEQTKESFINHIVYSIKNSVSISELKTLWEENKAAIEDIDEHSQSKIKAFFNERKGIIEGFKSEPINPEFEEPQEHPEHKESFEHQEHPDEIVKTTKQPKKLKAEEETEAVPLEIELKSLSLVVLRNRLIEKLHKFFDSDRKKMSGFLHEHTNKEIISRLLKAEAIKVLVLLEKEMEDQNVEDEEVKLEEVKLEPLDLSKETSKRIAEETDKILKESHPEYQSRQDFIFGFTDGFDIEQLTRGKALAVYHKIFKEING